MNNIFNCLKFWKLKLWQQVILSLILGIITGIILKEDAQNVKFLGQIFISLIKMVIVPLIFFALLSGITSMNGEANFTRVGIKGIIAYMSTATFAVLIGLLSGIVFQPGAGVDLTSLIHKDGIAPVQTTAPSISQFLLDLIPTNPIAAMAEDHFLQLIIFTIFLGITINTVGEKARPVKEVINSGAQIMFKMIEYVIKLAPLGVFGFIAWVVGSQGLEVLESLAKLIITVLSACTFQYLMFGLMFIVFGRLSPIPFYKKMLVTQSLAFATSSSKATLSTAMTELQNKMGVSKSSANFLMPLGACINMDGTAIYLGICALFFSQAFGISLQPHDYAMLVLTCTLGSIGAAGIPSGSIIFMGMVLSSVGLPLEGIGIILGIDRILDMIRTTINITGDATVTTLVDRSENTLNEKAYYSK